MDIGPPSPTLPVLVSASLADSRKHGPYQHVAQVANTIMYGITISAVAIPVMYGSAAIIFSHRDFADFTPALSKLVIFSSVVHQAVFTLLSSLPFAIGQVQDAGLLFLSAMATSICNSLGDDVPVETKVTTSIVTIGIATASLGVCLVIMGRLKLATLGSYLPVPVIGGYLAFIGIFCFYAGLALCTGRVVNNFESMINIFDDAHAVLLCLPGVLGGALLFAVAFGFNNTFILSGISMMLPVVFFFILIVGGIALDDARSAGWVNPTTESVTLTDLVNLFDFNHVHWGQIPQQFAKWVGLVFIVAFGSCLDIAAIELNMGKKLDANHELKTVGYSNIVSGLLGGYTGSYIFSQTIFAYRTKTNSRVIGVCVIIVELAIVVSPVSVMSYIPRFFFAATVIFIAIDLTVEWLILTYWKMYLREYAVLWMTFIAVNIVSLDLGMVIGVGIAIVNFILGYVRQPIVSRQTRSSGAPRTLKERRILDRKSDSIAYFELNGLLFFGSSVQILNVVQKAVYIRNSMVFDSDSGSNYIAGADLPPDDIRPSLIECLDGSPASDPNAAPTQFVVMDLSNVTAMDATVARSAFLILQKYCNNHEIVVVFAGALSPIQNLLLMNGVEDEMRFYSTHESALEFCENQLLAEDREAEPRWASSHDDERLSLILQQFISGSDDLHNLCGVEQYFERREVPVGHQFYAVGQFAEHFYFLVSGCIGLFVTDDATTSTSRLFDVLPSSLFGEMAFVSRQHRSLAAIAAEPSTVLEMSRKMFDALEEQNPALWFRLREMVMQSLARSLTRSLVDHCSHQHHGR
ncbi:hypothetical protein ON010_g12470 [Phytophthora cinnamomi]|nr:hypothetical protein ON010_g12470 [Phytophthora cinnamomi]